jgi:hypothetical protein
VGSAVSVDRAREALEDMRREVGLAHARNIDDREAALRLRNASRWALVFLAESRATEFAIRAAEHREAQEQEQEPGT